MNTPDDTRVPLSFYEILRANLESAAQKRGEVPTTWNFENNDFSQFLQQRVIALALVDIAESLNNISNSQTPFTG